MVGYSLCCFFDEMQYEHNFAITCLGIPTFMCHLGLWMKLIVLHLQIEAIDDKIIFQIEIRGYECGHLHRYLNLLHRNMYTARFRLVCLIAWVNL